MKVIAIARGHGTLNYLCMVHTKKGADWEFLPELSLAYPFRTISEAQHAINERFPPISGTTHNVQYVLVFSEPPSDKDSPLLKFLKTPVEDIMRKAADNYKTPWYFDGKPLERPLGSMRGQISKETLDAVDPAKKDPTE